MQRAARPARSECVQRVQRVQRGRRGAVEDGEGRHAVSSRRSICRRFAKTSHAKICRKKRLRRPASSARRPPRSCRACSARAAHAALSAAADAVAVARPVKVRAQPGEPQGAAVTRSLARRESRLLLVAKLRIVGKLSIGLRLWHDEVCARQTGWRRLSTKLRTVGKLSLSACSGGSPRCARAAAWPPPAPPPAPPPPAATTAAGGDTDAKIEALLARAERLENLVSSPEKARATDVAATRLQSAHRGRSSRRLSGATAGAAARRQSSVASTDSRRQSAIPAEAFAEAERRLKQIGGSSTSVSGSSPLMRHLREAELLGRTRGEGGGGAARVAAARAARGLSEHRRARCGRTGRRRSWRGGGGSSSATARSASLRSARRTGARCCRSAQFGAQFFGRAILSRCPSLSAAARAAARGQDRFTGPRARAAREPAREPEGSAAAERDRGRAESDRPSDSDGGCTAPARRSARRDARGGGGDAPAARHRRHHGAPITRRTRRASSSRREEARGGRRRAARGGKTPPRWSNPERRSSSRYSSCKDG